MTLCVVLRMIQNTSSPEPTYTTLREGGWAWGVWPPSSSLQSAPHYGTVRTVVVAPLRTYRPVAR
ncbi:hypothetical protein J6590_060376, partial [Homalodisca vitripennis]